MEFDKINTIDHLQKVSEERSYDINDIHWSREINHKIMWLPESINPLFYLPSYGLLSVEEKIKINQYYALGLCEKFVFLEEALVLALRSLAKQKKIPPHLEKISHVFIEEEIKHSEMFADLCNKALPHRYQGERFYFFKNSMARKKMEVWLFSKPNTFVFWSWLAAYFEEKTVIVSREYLKAKKNLDPLFVQVHAFHLRDELRHVEIDRHFFDHFYKGKNKLKKIVAKKMFQSALEKIITPKKTLKKIMQETCKDLNINNRKVYDQLMIEIHGVSKNINYMRVMFGHHNFPVFSRLIQENKEMKSLQKFLIR